MEYRLPEWKENKINSGSGKNYGYRRQKRKERAEENRKEIITTAKDRKK